MKCKRIYDSNHGSIHLEGIFFRRTLLWVQQESVEISLPGIVFTIWREPSRPILAAVVRLAVMLSESQMPLVRWLRNIGVLRNSCSKSGNLTSKYGRAGVRQ